MSEPANTVEAREGQQPGVHMRVLSQDGWVVDAIARGTHVGVTVSREGETVYDVILEAEGYSARWEGVARDGRGKEGAQTHGTMFKVEGRATGDLTISWAQTSGGELKSVATRLER